MSFLRSFNRFAATVLFLTPLFGCNHLAAQPPNFAALARQASGPMGDAGGGQGFAAIPEGYISWLFNPLTILPPDPPSFPINQFPPELHRWPNGQVGWYYDPTNLPAEIDGGRVLEFMQRSARKWMDVCNVQITYLGIGSELSGDQPTIDFSIPPKERDGRNTISWVSAAKKFPRALPNYHYSYSRWVDEITKEEKKWITTERDMYFNIDAWKILGKEWGYGDDYFFYYTLEAEITKLFGELLNLHIAEKAMNNNSIFNYRFHGDPFMRSLGGANVEDCIDQYGRTAKTDVTRIFNWMEGQLENADELILKFGLAGPRGQLTEAAYGGYYRYLPKGRMGGTYLGEYQGMVYVLFPNRPLRAVGTLQELLPYAISWGF